MTLMKRGNVWWSYIYIDGVRRQTSTGATNRREAERIELKLKRDANRNRHQLIETDPKMTFGDLAARFIANGAGTYHLERLAQILPYFADIPVLRINKGRTRDYIQYRRRRDTAISDATINRDLSVLRHLMYWAVDEAIIISNPLARLRLLRERKTRRPVLSVAEELPLIEVAPNHLAPIIMTALDTGMRRGEIFHQRWEDIDLERRLLWVTHSKTPEGESREIPLTQRLLSFLSVAPKRDGRVFTYRDRPLRNVKTAWGHAIQKATHRHVRFHDLRHTFNTRLMEAGVIQEVRKALMGHSSGDDVHAIYTHVELPMKREAITKLEHWKQAQLENLDERRT